MIEPTGPTIAEQISDALSIPSSDVTVTEQKGEFSVLISGSEPTPEQQVIINGLLPLSKDDIKQIKAENKALRKRISEAIDFADLKEKITKIKDSETTPTKWADKTDYLEGEYIEHKGIIYRVLEDHTADKAAEPQDTPELYEAI